MRIILKKAVAGLEMAHLHKITSSFEFSVLTLTVPGLRLRKVQNTLCFSASASFPSTLTTFFRIFTSWLARFVALVAFITASGCDGVNCPFNRPACCDNALFGCGPFDLPQGCSCGDYFSRSFSGAPVSQTAKRISPRSVQDSTWRISLEKTGGSCNYLRNSIQATLLIRTQGRQIQVRALGYPRLRGTRTSRLMRMRGKQQIGFPACTVQLDASILLANPSQGTAQSSLDISCPKSNLSCRATYYGIARRI